MYHPDYLEGVFGKVESEFAAARILELLERHGSWDAELDVSDFNDRNDEDELLVGFVCLAEDGYIWNSGGKTFMITDMFRHAIRERLPAFLEQ